MKKGEIVSYKSIGLSQFCEIVKWSRNEYATIRPVGSDQPGVTTLKKYLSETGKT